MRANWFLVSFLAMVCTTTAITRFDLYTYGKGVDNELARGDDTASEEIFLSVPIIFYSERYESIFVNTNGLLSFRTDIPAFLNMEFPLDYPAIAPLYSNIDTTVAGNVFYRETQDAYSIAKASDDIRKCFPDHRFYPSSIFIATWSDVGYHPKASDKTNTFQVAVISNGNDSYVQFLYPESDLKWIQAKTKIPGISDARAQIGFISEDTRFFTVENSGTENIRRVVSLSNCEQAGKFMYHVGNTYENVEEPALYASSNTVNEIPRSCSQGGSQQCHTNANCVNRQEGFCCVCIYGYYGNGKNCIKNDAPFRVNGEITGELNGRLLDTINLQAYVVVKDGRSYTALSHVPDSFGFEMQTLSIFGGVLGWLFAKSKDNSKNGYQITGGVFNHTSEIIFTDTNEKITIRQHFMGLDVFDQLKMKAEIKGSIPKIPHGSKLDINDYEEQYTISRPGLILSQSSRAYKTPGLLTKYPFKIEQSIVYEACQYASPEDVQLEPLTLKVTKNFIGYESRDRIVRYGMENKIGHFDHEDPCVEGRQTCGDKSSCVIEGNSFRCVCDPGYEENYSNGRTDCFDVDECVFESHNCDENAVCINQEGSFTCECNEGFEGNGITCSKIQVCNNNRCHPNARCYESRGRPMCQCNEGFTGDGYNCWELEQAGCDVLHNCSPYATCSGSDQYGPNVCRCLPGYEGDGYTCVPYRPTYTESPSVPDVTDIPEDPCRCDPNARCYKSRGRSECECNEGFTGNGYQCWRLEQDECTDSADCDSQASCYSSGEYYPRKCRCNPGYEGDGYTCYPVQDVTDVPEVPDNPEDPYLENPGPETTAVPETDSESSTYLPDGYVINADCIFSTCICPSNYQRNGRLCYRRDETTISPPTDNDNYDEEESMPYPLPECFENLCMCPRTYKLNKILNICQPDSSYPHDTKGPSGSKYSCDVINKCHPYAQCVYDPTVGKYQCRCTGGYEGDGIECTQMEQSCQDRDICDIHASCIFDPSSTKHICVCEAGYHGDGHVCRPVECITSEDCDENAECKYSEESHLTRRVCICKDGYVKDQSDMCTPDIDNCDGVTCADHATCHWNANNEIYCQCDPGYEGNGIEHCEESKPGCDELNDCDYNAECEMDEDHKYKCVCRNGYYGDGKSCTAKITCENDPYLCAAQATCINSISGFICECNPGYKGNGTFCSKISKKESNFLLLNQGMATLRIPFEPSLQNPGRPIQLTYYQMVIGLDIDCNNARVYWSDITNRVIKSSNYDGSNIDTFLSQDIISPEGLSIDWVSRNIFWTDSRKDTIEVANLDTKVRKVLFDTKLVDPRGIAVHPYKGKIFWSDWNRKNPKIEWANMDGSDRETFLQGDSVGLPNSLAIDWDTDELCYADAGTKKIECVQIDTMERRTAASNCSYPFGLAITPSHIYWSDWTTQKIERVDKSTRIRQMPLPIPLGGVGNKLYGLAAVLDSCRSLSNLCEYDNGQCPKSHLCLLDGKGGRSCVCGKTPTGPQLCN